MKISWLFLVLAFTASAFANDPALDLIYQSEGDRASVINNGFVRSTPRLGNRNEVSVEPTEYFSTLRFLDKSNQFIEINGKTVDYEKGFSISVWIHPASKKGVMELFSLGSDSKPSGVRLRLNLTKSGGAIAFVSGNGVKARSLRTRDDSVPVSTWTHIAAVYDGSDLRLYINGDEAASRKAGDMVFNQPKSLPLVIGNYTGKKDAYPYVGLMGPVKLYNIPLTQEEISKLAKPEIANP